MTNTSEMTNTELQAALIEAVAQSNRYFEDGNWALSEYWHVHAVLLQSVLENVRRVAISQH